MRRTVPEAWRAACWVAVGTGVFAAGGCLRGGFAEWLDTDACSPVRGAGLVSGWGFAGSGDGVVADDSGRHPGRVVGTVDEADGPCSTPSAAGTLLVVEPSSYVEVPDSPDFDLTDGALEILARIGDTSLPPQGVVSRDAMGTTRSGHLSVFVEASHVIVRLQEGEPVNASYYRCSEGEVTAGEWLLIGVGFGAGGFRLWIDGQEQNAPPTIAEGGIRPCDQATTAGIAGNDNPWVIGQLSWTSNEGAATPVDGPALGSAVDFVRVYDTGVDFGALARTPGGN